MNIKTLLPSRFVASDLTLCDSCNRGARFRLIFFLCLAVTSIVFAQVVLAQNQSPKPPPVESTYIIQPNDLLEIYVWKDQDLSRKVLVRPDGRISFPLIQDLPVAGMSPAQVKDEIEKRLKEFIEVPNVTVIIEAIQSYRVFLTGKVGKPGAIMAEKPITVLQALSLGGGFLEFADLSKIVIIRQNGAENTLFRFNYVEAISGKNYKQNMLLRSGDVIVVP